MLIVSHDKQRIEQWQQVSGVATRVTVSLEEIARLTGGQEKTVLVDLAGFDDQHKTELETIIRSNKNADFFVFVAVPEEQDGIRWIRAGAKGYGNRLMNDVIMDAALSSMNNGEIWASKLVIQYLLNKLQQSGNAGSVIGLSMLTARELDIAEAVGQGMNNKEISEKFSISERTVKAHMNKIFKKMNVQSRVQLALELEKAKAERGGIIYN